MSEKPEESLLPEGKLMASVVLDDGGKVLTLMIKSPENITWANMVYVFAEVTARGYQDISKFKVPGL